MARCRLERALDDLARGGMVILVDDPDREDEGDLCMAAQCVDAAAVNFMATFGRGLICLAMPGPRLDALALPPMVADNQSPFGTAFTVSIEAASGVTTGISAFDRARTIQVAQDPACRPEDLVRPGHVFPLRARHGGVLARRGQTEGSVDLAAMAGLRPAAVICEIMADDGQMARGPGLLAFARQHQLTVVSVEEVVDWRWRQGALLSVVDSAPAAGAAARLVCLKSAADGRRHWARVPAHADLGRAQVAVEAALGGAPPSAWSLLGDGPSPVVRLGLTPAVAGRAPPAPEPHLVLGVLAALAVRHVADLAGLDPEAGRHLRRVAPGLGPSIAKLPGDGAPSERPA